MDNHKDQVKKALSYLIPKIKDNGEELEEGYELLTEDHGILIDDTYLLRLIENEENLEFKKMIRDPKCYEEREWLNFKDDYITFFFERDFGLNMAMEKGEMKIRRHYLYIATRDYIVNKWNRDYQSIIRLMKKKQLEFKLGGK
jgi:hypothetical protein